MRIFALKGLFRGQNSGFKKTCARNFLAQKMVQCFGVPNPLDVSYGGRKGRFKSSKQPLSGASNKWFQRVVEVRPKALASVEVRPQALPTWAHKKANASHDKIGNTRRPVSTTEKPVYWLRWMTWWVKGVATDCWQVGVRQFHWNKRISDETKAMIWQKHEIYWLEAEQ